MCEVWKWILIATGAPLVGLNFWVFPLWGIFTRRQWDRQFDRTRLLLPYRRYLFLAILIFMVATVVYLAHCT